MESKDIIAIEATTLRVMGFKGKTIADILAISKQVNIPCVIVCEHKLYDVSVIACL